MLNGVTARLCPDQRAKRLWMIGGGIGAAVLIIIIIVVATTVGNSKFTSRDVLRDGPLIDGHNDLPYKLFKYVQNQLGGFNFTDLETLAQWNPDGEGKSQTDLKRLRAGMMGAQFWAAYTPCTTGFKDSVARTFEQIDVIKRLVKMYPHDLQLATDVAGIRDAFHEGRIASLIGVEGGHSIDSRLSVLRTLYAEGVRYMSLTHNCHQPWVESNWADQDVTVNQTKAAEKGLTAWGKTVIREMNRLGMMVDLAHVSNKTMADALEVSVAPVIFSHSSAYGMFAHSRNVRDEILKLLVNNNGVIMVNFGSDFIHADNATLAEVANHIEYIRNVTGSAEHIGLGADYDGTKNPTPHGLEDVSKYPALFDLLIERGWSRADLGLVAGGNLLRVLEAVELKRDELAETMLPADIVIPKADLDLFAEEVKGCRSDYELVSETTEAPTTVAPTTVAPTTEAPPPTEPPAK